jgi:hypothetical protein
VTKSAHPRQINEIGWKEIVALPKLGIPAVKAKIDTGARTSALHAVDLKPYERDGVSWIAFRMPLPDEPGGIICRAPVLDERPIKNTSGIPEDRYVISTTLVLGHRNWRIELSLADRENMGFDLILGRTAIRRRGLLVNPGRSFLVGAPMLLATKKRRVERARQTEAL